MNASIECQIRVNEALSIRKKALRKLQAGERFDHRFLMKLTRLPLKQARAWKVKP